MSNGTPALTPPPLLLKPKEAAKVLSISPRKLWALTASQQIEVVRIDRSVRYSVESLNRFIESRKSGAAQ
ncbi:MAG: helix-turn-helix domain-containing protein [Planctomycetota bacterium]